MSNNKKAGGREISVIVTHNTIKMQMIRIHKQNL